MSAHHTLPAIPGTVHRGTFDAALPPVLTIASGDTVELKSLSGDNADLPPDTSGFTVSAAHRNVLERVAPGLGPHFMTGPIAVKDAMPGDELIVDVIAVELATDWGWNLTRAGKGTLPDAFPNERRMHIGIDRERRIVKMPWGLELPAAPFFGIIGVAPPPGDGPQTSVIPRAWGGNIDCKHLGAGARLHLPVFNEGALLSAGDGHALQGDGEVCLTAVETGLRGTLRLTVAKDTGIAGPWAETPAHIITMAFDPDLDVAAQSAVRAMVRMIERLSGLPGADAYTLCSIAADVHVTQLVNVHKGAHVMLAKSALGLR
ncbi:MAG: acetamidase/formamidase family protein [Pseudolabrys sp.]|nr:acetamidase/formamidase family protein [Pseudolabrys sp.]MDP2296710.1 acetamidase/formamidase family protein [Pseudolabrys sp.]